MQSRDWDPENLIRNSNGIIQRTPTKTCLKRIRKDLRDLFRDPLPGIFAIPDDTHATVIHALITGPIDTPYEGGFFYFLFNFPDDYPHSPPKVKIMTTGGGTVRFNPNLYANGKVCLSILGTWSGPSWSPIHTLSSVLISIQSLMNEKPYHNEPGFEIARDIRDVENYNDCILHETLRIAVIEMCGGGGTTHTTSVSTSQSRSLPDEFHDTIKELFLSYYDYYINICDMNCHKDGNNMIDPFGSSRGIFRYNSIKEKIQQIYQVYQEGDTKLMEG